MCFNIRQMTDRNSLFGGVSRRVRNGVESSTPQPLQPLSLSIPCHFRLIRRFDPACAFSGAFED